LFDTVNIQPSPVLKKCFLNFFSTGKARAKPGFLYGHGQSNAIEELPEIRGLDLDIFFCDPDLGVSSGRPVTRFRCHPELDPTFLYAADRKGVVDISARRAVVLEENVVGVEIDGLSIQGHLLEEGPDVGLEFFGPIGQ
jgi:hypothetical protein